MHNHHSLLATSIVLLALISCSSAGKEPVEADLLFFNGLVYQNAQLQSDSLAVKDGRIINASGVTTAKQRVDLEGSVILPGFHDSHTHLLAGSFVFDRLLLVGATSMNNIENKVRSFANENSSDPWLIGYGWILNLTENPTGVALDDAAGDRPLALFDSSGHALLVNSLAMEQAGITTDTPDPSGGTIVRDEQGIPTGLLLESAIELVSPLMVNSFTDEQLSAGLLDTVSDFHAAGVTGISEILAVPGVNLSRPWVLTEEEALSLRIRYYLPVFSEADLEGIAQLREHSSEMTQFAGVKVWVDGSTGSGEAWTLEASAIDDEHYGSHYFDSTALIPIIEHAEQNDYDLKMHVNGDAAVQAALDALEAVDSATPLEQRHILEHVVLIDPADYTRIAALGLTASVQPSHRLVAAYGDQAEHWSDGRFDQSWDFAALAEAGIPLALGTDWPVWPTPDAMVNLGTAIDGVGDKGLDFTTALHSYTENSARISGLTNTGTLSLGSAADFVILSADPASTRPAEIRIESTWVAGAQVY